MWELWSGDSWIVGVWMMGLRVGELTVGGVEGGDSSMNELTRYWVFPGNEVKKLSETRLTNGFEFRSISENMPYEWYNLWRGVDVQTPSGESISYK